MKTSFSVRLIHTTSEEKIVHFVIHMHFSLFLNPADKFKILNVSKNENQAKTKEKRSAFWEGFSCFF